MSDTEEIRQRAEQYNHQLLTSEDQYVNELETIVTYIVKPLEKAATRCKIPGGEQEVKQVFKYLNSMLQFHITFLSVIREAISVIPDLYKYIGFIQMYDDYLMQYDDILKIFATWRSMEFREFISMRLKHKNVKKTIIDRLDSLPWYLYRPFDRIKEYHRFLKDIEKITKKSDDSHSYVGKTLGKIRPLYKKIKQNEDRLQQKTRLLEVQLQIHGFNSALVKDDRFFVYNRQCQMKRRGLPGRKFKHIQIYLFNDLFLWVSARGRFKGSYSFYKENLEIYIPSNSKKGDALFSIGLKTEKHKRLIVCADDLQRDKLMNTIIRTYESCKKKLFKTLNGTDKDAIKQVKKRGLRDTNVKGDNEFSASSLDTRNTYYEHSVSNASDRTDITDSHIEGGGKSHYVNGHHKPSHSNASNGSEGGHKQAASNGNGYTNPLSTVKENTEYGDRRRYTGHLPPPENAMDAELSVDDSASTIQLNLNGMNGGGVHAISPKSNATTPPTGNTSANVTPIAQDIIPNDFPRTVNGLGKTRTITPEPSVEIHDNNQYERKPSPITLIHQPESNSVSQSESYSVNNQSYQPSNGHAVKPNGHSNGHSNRNGHGGHGKSHRDAKHHHHKDKSHRERKHKHHVSRKEQIKQLQEEMAAMKEALKSKDERIKDLEDSNKIIRETLILKDNKIHSLQDQVQHLSLRLSSHNVRAKSISNIVRPPRAKRASSFSIGKGGKITRTAMLPKQLDHNKKIRREKTNGSVSNGGYQSLRDRDRDRDQQFMSSMNGGSQTPSVTSNGSYPKWNLNGHATKNGGKGKGALNTPHNGLQRAHSEHRKAKSNLYFDLNKKPASSYTSSYQ